MELLYDYEIMLFFFRVYGFTCYIIFVGLSFDKVIKIV